MVTATNIIKDALEEIGYLGAESDLEAVDAQKALRKLNDMLASWGESGILPGAIPVDSLADEVRAQRGVIEAITMNLAGRCAVSFQQPMTETLKASINASSEALLRITSVIGDVAYPDTLPIGSGNECYEYVRFFPSTEAENF